MCKIYLKLRWNQSFMFKTDKSGIKVKKPDYLHYVFKKSMRTNKKIYCSWYHHALCRECQIQNFYISYHFKYFVGNNTWKRTISLPRGASPVGRPPSAGALVRGVAGAIAEGGLSMGENEIVFLKNIFHFICGEMLFVPVCKWARALAAGVVEVHDGEKRKNWAIQNN